LPIATQQTMHMAATTGSTEGTTNFKILNSELNDEECEERKEIPFLFRFQNLILLMCDDLSLKG
jgi:hypothetical protein